MIYGTAWKKEQTTKLVELALKNGFRAIDTACQPKHYQEHLVGEGIAQAMKNEGLKREELFIQTKYTPIGGQDPNNTPYDPTLSIYDQVQASFEVSKQNLKTDFIDSLVMHSPLRTLEETMEAWQSMEAIVKRGEVGQLGLSNCYDLPIHKRLYELATIKPKVIQNRFYADSGYDKEIRAWAKEQNISYQSFWSLTANPHILGSHEVLQLAQKYQKTQPQIFYRFLEQIGITPLNGTSSQEHMRDDLVIGSFTLSEEEVELLKQFLK
jgi:diketogulonate reductase-like aldo/keto reductase